MCNCEGNFKCFIHPLRLHPPSTFVHTDRIHIYIPLNCYGCRMQMKMCVYFICIMSCHTFSFVYPQVRRKGKQIMKNALWFWLFVHSERYRHQCRALLIAPTQHLHRDHLPGLCNDFGEYTAAVAMCSWNARVLSAWLITLVLLQCDKRKTALRMDDELPFVPSTVLGIFGTSDTRLGAADENMKVWPVR